MRLFGFGGQPPDPELQRRRDLDEQRLAAGGIPVDAEQRLRDQASRQGTPGHIFTSDLSVNELAFVRRHGFEPLGQVMGCSVYHVGWQQPPTWSWNSGELDVLTGAFAEVRRRALARLQAEAEILGAGGVVGVRLNHNVYEWGMDLLEVQAVGTAIRAGGDAASKDPPFLSDLSGQELAMLLTAGYRPVGIAIGNCSWYQVPNYKTQQATTSGIFGSGMYNQELKDYTRGVYGARSKAMSRMEQAARHVKAVGVVGADVSVESEPREIDNSGSRRIDMIFHFTAIGTAIAYATERTEDLEITPVVSLQD